MTEIWLSVFEGHILAFFYVISHEVKKTLATVHKLLIKYIIREDLAITNS